MIHIFNHHAMATLFQVRIDGEEPAYAAQSARAALAVADRMESLLSRFRENSEISQISRLAPARTLRLSEPVFACLALAKEMETVTRGAFSICATERKQGAVEPRWSLDPAQLTIRCDAGRLAFDLGAIGKGFALDRMADELAEWECSSYLLVAGGSSILAGDAPSGLPGWDSGLGDDHAEFRCSLVRCALSGSGVAVKGRHILDPRTCEPAIARDRAWAIASSAAVSDALSTACMVLGKAEIAEIFDGQGDWLAVFNEGRFWRRFGGRRIAEHGLTQTFTD